MSSVINARGINVQVGWVDRRLWRLTSNLKVTGSRINSRQRPNVEVHLSDTKFSQLMKMGQMKCKVGYTALLVCRTDYIVKTVLLLLSNPMVQKIPSIIDKR